MISMTNMTIFAEYTDFISEADDDYPVEEYVNSVLVEIVVRESPLSGALTGRKETTIRAASVGLPSGIRDAVLW